MRQRQWLSLAFALQLVLAQVLQCPCPGSDHGKPAKPHVHACALAIDVTTTARPVDAAPRDGDGHDHQSDAVVLANHLLARRPASLQCPAPLPGPLGTAPSVPVTAEPRAAAPPGLIPAVHEPRTCPVYLRHLKIII